VSMGVRALYAWRFVRGYCAARGQPNLIGWSALLPQRGAVVAFAAAAACTRLSAAAYVGVRPSVLAQKGHIIIGGIWLIICLLSWCVLLFHSWKDCSILMRAEVTPLSVTGLPGLLPSYGDDSGLELSPTRLAPYYSSNGRLGRIWGEFLVQFSIGDIQSSR